MAEDKKSFILYADLIHTVRKLPKEDAGELLLTILQYVNDEEPDTDKLPLIIQVVFEPIKQQLKRDLKKFESKRKQWSDAGKRSAEARALNKKQRTLTDVKKRSTVSTVNVNDTVNVNVNKEKRIKKESASPHPTEQEFMTYAKSRFKDEKEYLQYRDILLNKYEAWKVSGWVNGRSGKKIKVWQTTLLNTINAWKNK